MRVRTRFAPSPTGFMHIGNLRTAIFAFLIAKKHDGEFLLRVEDTDQERKVEGAIDFIYDTLSLCNLNIDEGPNNPGNFGPYVQSERLEFYKEYATKLVDSGQAYYCFCSEEELDAQRKIADERKKPFLYNGKCSKLSKEEIESKINNGEKYVVRQKMPKEGITVIDDLIHGQVRINNEILDDQVLLKSDGFPTYNYANVIDDHLMQISHVVRGHEYLDQTAKYNLLYDAFGWEKPVYIHVAMVLGEDGNKLSKRNGDASFMDLYQQGYLPEAIVNYLVFLGWSPTNNQELFSMNELIQCFDEKRISKNSSQYDVKKLKWYNSQYIKKMDDDSYIKLVRPFLEKGYDLSDKDNVWINHLLILHKNHLDYGEEIIEQTDLFFKDNSNLSTECIDFMNSDLQAKECIKAFIEESKLINDWNVENIKLAIEQVKEKTGIKGKMLYMPIRIMASGQMHGPELADTIYLIGQNKVIERLGKEVI